MLMHDLCMLASVDAGCYRYFLHLKIDDATVDIKAVVVSLFICRVSRAAATSGLKFYGNSNGLESGDS